MRIAISGASGFVGRAASAALAADGHDVVALQRGRTWDPATGRLDAPALGRLDAVVHLAGENVAGGRWTAARKQRIADSRGPVTERLCRALGALPAPPGVLVCASATGIYGDRGDSELDERSAPGRGFLAEVAQAWEAGTGPARAAGIRVVNLRIGMVLDRSGGALRRMLLPFRLGLGGRLGDGRQWTSWITLRDLVRAVEFVLARGDLQGPVLAVAPEPVTNAQFTRALAKALHRPAWFPVPKAALRLLFGELAGELLLASQRCRPDVLLQAGFRFEQPAIGPALQAALGRGPGTASARPRWCAAFPTGPRRKPMRSTRLGAILLATTVPLVAQTPPDDQRLAAACNQFAAALYAQLGATASPTCSPGSIAIALLMLLPGARGETADELAVALRLPDDLRGERLATAAHALLTQLGLTPDGRRRTETPTLVVTNDLWVQQGHALVPAYVQLLRDHFAAAPQLVDFAHDTDGARRRINDHIAKATNDRIRDLLSADAVPPTTRVVLTNALWFKAAWLEPFPKAETKDRPFQLADGKAVTVPTMRHVRDHAYAEHADWQALSMAFATGGIVCDILLPRDGLPLARAEAALLAGEHLAQLRTARVSVELPRFGTSAQHSLKAALAGLGVRAAFVLGRADFTAMDPSGELFVGDVVHKVWVQVDEAGAEAAAATAVVMRAGSAMVPAEPKTFRVDRPFAFGLRDRQTGLLLFVGRVTDPRVGAS
ncbi:MAG: TIGR01777 family oxidoreductase [Planctomycetes bacterium]|nr:TIGR01777 family oxidoreductase [Planctomycetota bacterium]